jgi:transcriptional regulator GlxA family with amidase domain
MVLVARLSDFNRRRFAVLWGISLRHLDRFFHKELGRTPQEWLDEQRMVAARDLLGTMSLKEVAKALGFKQLSHFCRCFKLCYHMTPTQFLEKFRPSQD